MKDLTKRQKIIIASVLVTIGFIISTQQFFFFTYRYKLILAITFLSYILSIFALWEGMSKLKAVVLLLLPTMFTLGYVSFYYLLPIRWLTRVPSALLFGVLFYSLLLAQNVFGVAALKKAIPLYRAASTVSFLFTLFTAGLIYSVIYALRLPFYWNSILVAGVSFLLILQYLWSLELEKINYKIFIQSFIPSLIIGEFAVTLSFWPVMLLIWSMALFFLMYILLAIITQNMRERLNRRVVWEYLGLGAIIYIFVILTTTWSS